MSTSTCCQVGAVKAALNGSMIDRGISRLALAAGLLRRRPRVDLLLLSRRRLDRLALQLVLALLQPRQAIAAPRQSRGQFAATLHAELAVLLRIGRLRFGQHPGHLLVDAARRAIGVQRRAGTHLGAAQRHQPKPHQARFVAQPQHGEEHLPHARDMALHGTARSPCGRRQRRPR